MSMRNMRKWKLEANSGMNSIIFVALTISIISV